MIKHWTKEEEQTLLQLKEGGKTLREISEVLNRTLDAVRTRSKRLKAQTEGESYNLSWTEEQLSKLREDLDYDQLVVVLGKSKRAIQAKCEKLGIRKRFGGGVGTTMDYSKPCVLYLADFGEFKKVGVTQQTFAQRFSHEKFYKILDSVELGVIEALETEREILRNLRQFRVTGDLHSGGSECFNYNCTRLDELI